MWQTAQSLLLVLKGWTQSLSMETHLTDMFRGTKPKQRIINESVNLRKRSPLMVILQQRKLVQLKEHEGLAVKGHPLLVIQELHHYQMQRVWNRRGEMVRFGSHLWLQIISERFLLCIWFFFLTSVPKLSYLFISMTWWYLDKASWFQGRRNITATDSSKLLENKVSFLLILSRAFCFVGRFLTASSGMRVSKFLVWKSYIEQELICCLIIIW